MDEIDIPIKIRQLNSHKVTLQNQRKELQIYIENRQAGLKLLEKELKQKILHFNSLSEYVLLENTQMHLLNQSDEDENFDQGLLQKKSLEQLNFHMDKYFNYVSDSIITTEVQLIGQDNQYNASQVLTILVKIQKTIFPSSEFRSRQMVGDDDDHLVNTFRFSKSTTLDQLKEVSLKYWEIINKRNQSDDQMREEEQLRIIKDRFEFTDNEGIVVNHLLVEQYLQQYNQIHDSFSIILRRKKQKTQAKRGDDTQRNRQSSGRVGTASKTGNVSILERQSQNEDNKSARSSQQQQSQKIISENNTKSQTSKQSAELQQTEEEEEENFEDGPEFQSKLKNKLFLKYYQFFKRFDLIKKMFTLTQEEVEERGRAQEKPNIKKGYGCDDNNICVMVMIILMLIVNALFLSYLEDGPIMYSHIKKLNDLLNIGAQGKAGSFLDISSIQDIQAYLSNVESGMPFQLMDPNSSFNQNYQVIGGIRFRQARTKFKTCNSVTRKDIKTQVKCAENYYTDQTKETSLLSDGSKPWQYYKSTAFVNSTRIVYGQFSSYDQSGYIQDINKDQFSVGSYDRIIIEGMLENDAYFSLQLLSLFVTFTVRCKNDGALFFIELQVEYPSSGIFPNQPKILPFSSYIFGEGDSDPYSVKADINSKSPDDPNNYAVGKKLYGLMIAKVFFGLLQSMFIINQLLHYFRQNWHVFTKYLVSVTFIINCLVVVTNFSCVSEIFNLANSSITTEYLVGLKQFQDLGNQAVLYYSMTNTLGISMAMLMIRTYLFLTFFKSFEYIVQTIEQQYLAIAATFSLILSVLAGFTFISQQIWGYYLVNFSTFGRALLSLMLITISLFNQDQLYFYQPIMSMIFMLFFFFFILYFMSNLLAVIYIDSYRLLVLNNGEILPETWSKTDWLHWFLSWAPQKVKDKYIPQKEVSIVQTNSAQTEF